MDMEPGNSATAVRTILSHQEVVEDLNKVLSELNKRSKAEIAVLFADNGITGEAYEAQSCPVASWIRHECGWAETVIVAPSIVSAYPSKDFYKDPDLPTAITTRAFENVNAFMQAFDTGMYPFLLTKK